MAMQSHAGGLSFTNGSVSSSVPTSRTLAAPALRLAPAEPRTSHPRLPGTLVIAQASTSGSTNAFKGTPGTTTGRSSALQRQRGNLGRGAGSSTSSDSSPSNNTLQTQKGKPGRATSRSSSRDSSPSFWSQFYIAITGFPFPLGPVLRRNTVRNEVERDAIWTFEQTQALESFAVYTPVRMTVIKLASGGLWVHNPLAPTDECIRLVKELGYPVEYIVLGTFAYEHKQFVGPFSRQFPRAKVYVTPCQWSFPINLPPQFFGIFPSGVLEDDAGAPWADEIDQKLLLPPSIGVGDYVRFPEVAFFHRRTRTLMVTDALIFVADTPPDVIPVDALLSCARDGWLNRLIAGGLSREEVQVIARTEPVVDTPENRSLGWKRMALLVLFFSPNNLLQPEASFGEFSNRLIVAPVVETLVYSKIPGTVRAWVDAICRDWDVRQVIPTHFSAPVAVGPDDLRRAFAFAYGAPSSADAAAPVAKTPVPADSRSSTPLAALGRLFGLGRASRGGALPERAATFLPEDLKTLNNINNILLRIGAVRLLADE